MPLEKVQAFYQRLTTDEAFRVEVKAARNKQEYKQIVQAAGYDFSQEEYEEYTMQLLEKTATEENLQDLEEKELEAIIGGTTTLIEDDLIAVPLYGVVEPTPLPVCDTKPKFKPKKKCKY